MRTSGILVVLLILVAGRTVGAATTMQWVKCRIGSDSTWAWVQPITRDAVQTVLDKATPHRHVSLWLGPGNLDTDSSVWIHGNTSIRGSGADVSRITRTRFKGSDAVSTGHVVASAGFGRHNFNNGTTDGDSRTGVPTDSLADIIIEGVTVDGNCGRWPKEDPNRPGNFGINLAYVDRAQIRQVVVRRTLQTGIQFLGCRNVSATDIRVDHAGQQLNPGSRNGLNINCNATGSQAAGWARNYEVRNIDVRDQRDAFVAIANSSHVVIVGCSFSNRDLTIHSKHCFEFEGTSGETMEDFDISRITAIGPCGNFLRFGLSSGVTLRGVRMHQFSCSFDKRWHRAEALMLGRTNDIRLSDITIEAGSLTNINSAGLTKGASFVVLGVPTSARPSSDITLHDIEFRGAGKARGPDNRGLDIYGNLNGVSCDSLRLYDVEGVGFYVHPDSPSVCSDIRITNCLVQDARSAAVTIAENNSPGRIEGISIQRCLAVDTNTGQPGASFEVISSSGGTVKNVSFEECKVVRRRGMPGGFRVVQEDGGVIDSVSVNGNDFSQAKGAPYSVSGKVTNLAMPDPRK